MIGRFEESVSSASGILDLQSHMISLDKGHGKQMKYWHLVCARAPDVDFFKFYLKTSQTCYACLTYGMVSCDGGV